MTRASAPLAFSPIGPALLALALAVAGGLFLLRARQLVDFVRLGRPVARLDDVPRRVEQEVTVVLGQRKLLQRLLPGLMHAFIFWGFLVLLTTIAEAMGEVFQDRFAIPLVGHTRWLGLVQDVFAALVFVGVELAVFIRKVRRPDRFKGSHTQEADFVLLMILGIVLTLFLLRGAKIALGLEAAPRQWTPVSWLFSLIYHPMSRGATNAFLHLFLWAHILLILGFLVYIPYSKHLHIFTSEPNVFFTQTRARGHLEPLNLDLEHLDEADVRLGAATLEDLTWKQVLDTYSCTECGRCQNVCPAWNTGKPLSPKLLVMNLRDHVFEHGPEIVDAKRHDEDYQRVPLNPDVVEDEVIWDCVTCGACMQECPVDIEHVDHIVDMRRNLVMGESRFPAEAGTLIRNLERSRNPWGQQQSTRADWAAGLGVRVLEEGQPAPEYLYWVGCAGSFDERARRISEAVVRVLQRAAVPFAILGPREQCTGDPARRIGNEYLFQELAKGNIETLDGSGVRKVIANCPHCFNTLRNEYPDFGGRYEVIHHTELFDRLLREGRLRPSRALEESFTYHDPCYLGRHNGVYEEPRDVLGRLGARTTELPRHGARAFCCGAGGSRMWMEERLGKRINIERTEEAISTGAETLGVACPYCLIMLDDGAKAKGERIRVEDVAQVVARATGADAQ